MGNIEFILTRDERLSITEIPENIDKLIIVKHYTLSEFDHELINNCRSSHNRIGFALQLGILRHKGYNLKNSTKIPHVILRFVGKQLNVKAKDYMVQP